MFPSNVVANVGCQVVLTCLDEGVPPLDFTWSYNGVPVVVSEPRLLLVRETGELFLSNLRVEDSGRYSCLVRGRLNEASRTAVVVVEDPLVNPLSPPAIDSPTPSNLFILPGQTAQLVCIVTGSPPLRVVWFKDGVPVNASNPSPSSISVFRDNVLVVSNVSAGDEGVYRCTASNSKRNESREFSLFLTGAYNIQPFLSLSIYIEEPLLCMKDTIQSL